MLISVIMATRNQEKDLEECINSILGQTYRNFEFLILDDCSSDNTFKILSKYQKIDERIQVYSNKTNLGLTKSLNILIKHSKGSYIARQDSDDVSHFMRFEKQINVLRNSKYKFCISRGFIRNTRKKIPGISYYLPIKFQMNYKNPFIHGSLMIEKETLLKFGCYDEKYYFAQDYKLFSILLKNKIKYKYLNEQLYFLNTQNNISTKNKLEQKQFFKFAKSEFNKSN